MMELVLPGAQNLALFATAAFVILIVPGPVVLFLAGQAVARGRGAALFSVIGVHAATLAHVAAAALGLSAALAFAIVKYAGAAYLIWLGIKKLKGGDEAEAAVLPTARSHARLLRDGFLVNLLNPKTALFFLAFLPQFVEPSQGGVASQIVVLGLVFTALGILTDGSYALLMGSLSEKLRRSRLYARLERKVSGTLLIGLGLSAALADHRK